MGRGPGRYTVRFNLRLTEETAKVYRTAAERMGEETTSLLRTVLDDAAPDVERFAEAMAVLRAGNRDRAAEMYEKHLGSLVEAGQKELDSRREAEERDQS